MEITINNNYDFGYWERKLMFADGKPVCLGYCRVSTETQETEHFSLDNQKDRIREECVRRLGKGKFHLILILEDASGTLPYNRGGMKKGTYREGLQLVTEIIERGLVKYVVVYKMSRITRNLRVYLELQEEYLDKFGCEIISCTEPISNTTSGTRFLTHILGASAELERDNIASISRDGLYARMELRFFTGQTPFGWNFDRANPTQNRRRAKATREHDDTAEKIRSDICPNPITSPWVVKAYEFYKSGKGLRWIAAEFSRNKVETKRNRTKWDSTAIRQMLLNPIHAGFVILNEKLVEGMHKDKRLISPEDFFFVRDRLISQTRTGYNLRISPHHVFGQQMTCSICGMRMRVVPRSKGPRYECRGRSGSVRHPGFSVAVEGVEKRVLESIERLSQRKELVNLATEKSASLIDSILGNLEKDKIQYQSQLEEKKEELVRWCERFNKEDSDDSKDEMVFRIYKERILKDISECESRLSEIADRKFERHNREIRLKQAVSMLARFSELWENGLSLDEKKCFASYVIDSLTLEADGNWVILRLQLILGEEETDRIPIRGQGGRNAVGLEALTPAELTLAYYYLEGYAEKEVAEARQVSIQNIRLQKMMLLKRTGAEGLDEALEIVAPIVELRKDELLIGRRIGPSHKDKFTPLQIRHLELLAAGLCNYEIAKTTGRTESAVRSVIVALYRKLNAHSASEAIKSARERHLISGTSEWSDRLTSKQMDVLTLLADGKSQPEIAKELGLTLGCIKERSKCMLQKFGFHSKPELLAHARLRGWLK